ncbi:MAG: hypothetical protein ACI8XO_004210 [Verrucomicrobiales bacterium]|jgi:hypothetical protein
MESQYDDAAWQTDTDSEGATGGIGYGDNWFDGVDIGTPDGEQDGTVNRGGLRTYFRHRFTTAQHHPHFELHCLRDDGVIVYLDGVEVS